MKQGLIGSLILILALSLEIKAQEISPYLIGNNAWYDGAALNNFWDDMDRAGFQSIRIGGNAAEGYGTNYAKYLTLIDGIRSANAEPIVQVPHTFTAQQAVDLITYLNVTKDRKIKLWNISNEPDLASNNFGNAAAVSTYIKRIASALKSVDSTIITMGPETSWYQNAAYMTPLIGGSADITGKDEAGHYYIDVVTFHKYMFTDISGLESDVNNLLTKLKTVNAKRPANKQLSWGLTEFNTSYDNSKNTSPDQDVWSFHAGQLFAEIYGLGMRKGAFSMNAWSMFEGPDRSGTDLSLFDKDYKGRSNYYHSLMLGQNMKKNNVSATDNQSAVVVISMADTSGVAVMILNKNRTAGYDYSLRLDNGAFAQTKALQIKVNAGINQEITGSIGQHATQMLVFNSSGTLIKRYTYTSADADGRGEPLVEHITSDPVPVVHLTQPSGEIKIDYKSTITLSAEATDNGTIQKVEFTANGAVIGSSQQPPYSFAWTPKAAGTYVVSARAFDDRGGVGFATGTSVVVEKVTNYIPIPATIEAEAFDEMSGIQLETTTDVGGGQNIGYCDVGDWMDYAINVPADGQYLVEMRVASLNKTGAFNLYSGTTQLTNFALPNGTGDWQSWTTIAKTVSLKAGNQTLRIAVTGKDINLNWMRISTSSAAVSPQQLNRFRVFPNPCSGDRFWVDLGGLNDREAVNFQVVNLSGQLVYQTRKVFARNGVAEIEVSGGERLMPGVYLVVAQASGRKMIQKLVLD